MKIYTLQEVAAHFGKPASTIRRWKMEGRFTPRRPTPPERARLLKSGRLQRNRKDVWVVDQVGLSMIEVPERGR